MTCPLPSITISLAGHDFAAAPIGTSPTVAGAFSASSLAFYAATPATPSDIVLAWAHNREAVAGDYYEVALVGFGGETTTT